MFLAHILRIHCRLQLTLRTSKVLYLHEVQEVSCSRTTTIMYQHARLSKKLVSECHMRNNLMLGLRYSFAETRLLGFF
jgi:hypothetical protein